MKFSSISACHRSHSSPHCAGGEPWDIYGVIDLIVYVYPKQPFIPSSLYHHTPCLSGSRLFRFLENSFPSRLLLTFSIWFELFGSLLSSLYSLMLLLELAFWWWNFSFLLHRIYHVSRSSTTCRCTAEAAEEEAARHIKWQRQHDDRAWRADADRDHT